MGPNTFFGKPKRSSIDQAQSPVRGSKHWLVLAFVRSLDTSPDKSQ